MAPGSNFYITYKLWWYKHYQMSAKILGLLHISLIGGLGSSALGKLLEALLPLLLVGTTPAEGESCFYNLHLQYLLFYFHLCRVLLALSGQLSILMLFPTNVLGFGNVYKRF